MQLADIKIAGEQANGVPVQVVGASGFPMVPDACTSSGLISEDTLDTLGANGILGVGPFRQDCGIGCAIGGSSNPGFYYACSSAGCEPAVESLSQQLQNPVWLFAKDNNGVIVELPSVSPLGATNLAGSLVFGIGTEANNALGAATVFTLDLQGTFTTIYKARPTAQVSSTRARTAFTSWTAAPPSCRCARTILRSTARRPHRVSPQRTEA